MENFVSSRCYLKSAHLSVCFPKHMLNMKHLATFWLSLTVLLFAVIGCNEPALVGGELLQDDQIGIRYTDTVRMTARTVPGDSVRTFAPAVPLFSYLFGHLDDPVFGTVRASIYTEVGLTQINPDFINDTIDQQLDSVVLLLYYDTMAFYGNWNQEMSIEVLELAEPMDPLRSYFSNESIPTGQSLGMRTFTPEKLNQADTSLGLLRITLDPAFGQRLIDLPASAYASDTSLQNELAGFCLYPNFEATDGLIGFGLRIQAGGLVLHYSQDGEPGSYRFGISSSLLAKNVRFETDHSAAPVEAFFYDDQLGDSLLFVQGMAGPRVEIEFPNIRNLEGIAVNKAELTVYAGSMAEDKPLLFQKASQLYVMRENADGNLVAVEDASLALLRKNLSIIGGQEDFDPDLLVTSYTLNLTDAIQGMIDGTTTSNTIVLQAYVDDLYNRTINSDFLPVLKPERPNRTILLGPGHSTYPMMLSLTYSEVP
jgi:hypothetical protein